MANNLLLDAFEAKGNLIQDLIAKVPQTYSSHRAILSKKIHRAYRAYQSLYERLRTEDRSPHRRLTTLLEGQYPTVSQAYLRWNSLRTPFLPKPERSQKYQDRSPIQEELLLREDS